MCPGEEEVVDVYSKLKRSRQNISRIENQWRKIETFFILLKHPFLWTSFEKKYFEVPAIFFPAEF